MRLKSARSLSIHMAAVKQALMEGMAGSASSAKMVSPAMPAGQIARLPHQKEGSRVEGMEMDGGSGRAGSWLLGRKEALALVCPAVQTREASNRRHASSNSPKLCSPARIGARITYSDPRSFPMAASRSGTTSGGITTAP